MPLTTAQREWYVKAIQALDPTEDVIKLDLANGLIHYDTDIQTDESRSKPIKPEEFVHALVCILLVTQYGYSKSRLCHERTLHHGSSGSNSDKVDIIIYDDDGAPYAVWELKSAEDYNSELERATRFQLFGTAPLLTSGAPAFLVCGTILPSGSAKLKLRCIDYREHKDYDAWRVDNSPEIGAFPREYREPDYAPYVRAGARDLRDDCTTDEFRAVAASFHNEFFAEHPDNQLFEDLSKCLLAKIHSEKSTANGDEYPFQIFQPHGKPEEASAVFARVNALYSAAYRKYIDEDKDDEIDPRRFPPERVKSVVRQLEGMALTYGAALHADVMSAFFETILRSGFKQDRGMYFTHDNIARFMVEALDLDGLAKKTWASANHPTKRVPYIIDPTCGSGTFLLHAMHSVTSSIRNNHDELVKTKDDEDYYNSNFRTESPNAWAKDYLYGLDAKFIMAITAKLNMVLHGDGVAHIFRDDAYKAVGGYGDSRLRAITTGRSVSATTYSPPMCESFDVVLANPPFGITLPTETQITLADAFTLPARTPTEGLFLERAYQLMRPGGRLGVVLPESVLNGSDTAVRLLLLRLFKLKAVVTLPRNIFVDTPTLTSLVFAQKKSGKEIVEWDKSWDEAATSVEKRLAAVRQLLTRAGLKRFKGVDDLYAAVMSELAGLADHSTSVVRRGRNGGAVVTFKSMSEAGSVAEAAEIFANLTNSAAFREIKNQHVFHAVSKKFNYEYGCYAVSEIGYKLSKRGERVRENQLMKMLGRKSGLEVSNLHKSDEEVDVQVDTLSPERVLDYLRRDVKWD